MLRTTFALVLPLFVFTACKEPAAKDAPTASASASAATVTTASVPAAKATAAPSAAPVVSANAGSSAAPVASAKAGACAALEWDKDGMNAKATSFKGKVDKGEGSNARGDMEKFETLHLDKPACGPDKAPVEEVQLYTNDKTIDLKKMVGRTVTIEGEPFSSHTAHHHRPIVVEVKKLTAN
jgi:hypothetical protein